MSLAGSRSGRTELAMASSDGQQRMLADASGLTVVRWWRGPAGRAVTESGLPPNLVAKVLCPLSARVAFPTPSVAHILSVVNA